MMIHVGSSTDIGVGKRCEATSSLGELLAVCMPMHSMSACVMEVLMDDDEYVWMNTSSTSTTSN
jgi:hypothetical protein